MSDHLPFDPAKLAEPANRLIDAVRSATGILYEPTAIRRKARAEADAKLIEAEGKIRIAEVKERAKLRAEMVEARRQGNIESITAKAIQALPGQIADGNTDDDWVHQFFDYCKDIGDDQMQTLWARLLAGEVSSPGSFSILTLETVKTLRPKEADLFTRFCKYIWQFDGKTYVVSPHSKQYSHIPRGDSDLTDEEVLILSAYGLVALVPGYQKSIKYRYEADKGKEFIYFDSRYKVTTESPTNPEAGFVIGTAVLTVVGEELAKIAGAEPDREYESRVIEDWKNNHDIFIKL